MCRWALGRARCAWVATNRSHGRSRAWFLVVLPMCKCRSHGTFPLFGLQSSHLNICYYHQDPHRRPLRPGSRPRFCSDRRALLLIGAWHLPRRPGVGRALKRHPFSGLVDSAGELLHTP
ncbi:hypothetical protein HanLR1_Chr00c1164g0792831 [Helianthus annuus]|nr:hypothetical protein HanLR1_Chr00c3193g0870271 [Helianthus annuus]KAJ0803521.1 hypothetical protein HanLR1_Chr00c1794g0820721 [Helianthus annuus]KAJ0807589.1 hypothetical protein HanLR1_Chr00c1164g0792831 [Helianthus annuus]